MSNVTPFAESSNSMAGFDHGLHMVEQLAMMARRAYIKTKQLTCRPDSPYVDVPVPAWDGGCDTFGIQYRPVWPSIAEFFLRYRVAPDLFYYAQVDENRLASPQLLNTQAALDRYEKFRIDANEDLQVNLSCQTNRFFQELSNMKGWFPNKSPERLAALTLLSESLSLTPLFRYSLARLLELPEVPERYAEAAKWQLLPFVEGYQQHWGTILPLDFVAEVERQRHAALRD